MTRFDIPYPPDATPLTSDERAGLIPDYITTHGELNELEQKNIQDAILWVRGRRSIDVLDPGFVFELHKRMFNQVWRWAGRARTTDKNIGVDWPQISTQIGQLLANAKHWIENRTFPPDETAVRFHHRLVQIHPFPNGNGRHARLMTDLLLEAGGHEPFTWGMKTSSTPLETEGDRRRQYIDALRSADKNHYDSLLAFVRS